MLSFLFFILIFVLVVGLILLSTVVGFIRSIFGFGKRVSKNQDAQSENFKQPNSKSKVFKKTEGEYVDFEEIK